MDRFWIGIRPGRRHPKIPRLLENFNGRAFYPFPPPWPALISVVSTAGSSETERLNKRRKNGMAMLATLAGPNQNTSLLKCQKRLSAMRLSPCGLTFASAGHKKTA